MANKKEITVTRETVSAIRCGKDIFEVAKTADGRGVNVRNANGTLFIPVGAIGQNIARELLAMTAVANKPVVKRKRRTKAEIEAAKAPVE